MHVSQREAEHLETVWNGTVSAPWGQYLCVRPPDTLGVTEGHPRAIYVWSGARSIELVLAEFGESGASAWELAEWLRVAVQRVTNVLYQMEREGRVLHRVTDVSTRYGKRIRRYSLPTVVK